MSAVHLELTLAIKAPALIICTEQRSIYINTFPNTLTSEWAKNHDIRMFFCKHIRRPMSCTAITLKVIP